MPKKESDLQSKGPLLYIVQPDLEIASGKMQKSFLLKSNKKTSSFDHDGIEVTEEGNDPVAKQATKGKEEKKVQEFKASSISSDEECDDVAEEKKNTSFVTGVRKPFKEMDIEEKLRFLIHRPPYIPKVPCEVRTDEETIFGYVDSNENGIILIQSLSSSEMIKVKRDKIVSIRMLGI